MQILDKLWKQTNESPNELKPKKWMENTYFVCLFENSHNANH